MNNEYKYRPHIKYLKWIVPIFIFIPSTVIGWMGRSPEESLTPFIITSVIQAIVAVVIWRFLHKFTLVRVTCDEEAITYTNNKGNIRVEYGDIKKLKFPSVRYTGGWIKVISNKKSIRITVVLENIHRLLLDIKEGLDKRGLSDRYDEKKFFKFLKTSVHSDSSWQRLYRIWIKLLVTTIITTIIGVGTILFFDVDAFQVVLIILSNPFPLIAYYLTEVVFRRRVTRLSNIDSFTVPERDTEYEKAIYKKAIWIGTIAYIAIILSVTWG